MTNKKEFELIPYHENLLNSGNDINFNNQYNVNIKDQISEIVRRCNAILTQECNDFEKLSGRDIDTFYISKNKFLDIKINENFFFHQRGKGSFRFFLNNRNSTKFLNLDLEDLKIFSSKTAELNKLNFQEATKCKKTGLKHFKFNAIIYYKIVKYFSHGVVFSYKQLYDLKKTLNSLDSTSLNYILNLTSKNLPKENMWLTKLIKYDFKNFEEERDIKNFWISKRIIIQNNRKVFNGKLKLKNLFKSKKFIYALLLGSYAKWPKNHTPLPAVAIIGNDGAGKTTICEHVIKNFHKMDPAHINMKSEAPIMPSTKFFNKIFRKLLKFRLINKFNIFKIIISIFAQSINIFDQYIRYRVGMAFADSGHGITIFERYITDKLRGEFPNKKNKLLPLEQFFSFPDGFFYLDVKPEISIKRKINDNHSISEMTSKRNNYISLLEEFSELKKTHYDDNFEDSIKNLKNYIFELAQKKKEQLKHSSIMKRCIWKKNRNRVLSGKLNERFQKSSFI